MNSVKTVPTEFFLDPSRILSRSVHDGTHPDVTAAMQVIARTSCQHTCVQCQNTGCNK